jgi:hypothetical protein
MVVHNGEVASQIITMLVLEVDPILDSSKVVAQVDEARWLNTGYHNFACNFRTSRNHINYFNF